VVLTLAGAGAALIGDALHRHERELQIVSGALLIVLGLVVAGVVPVSWRERSSAAYLGGWAG